MSWGVRNNLILTLGCLPFALPRKAVNSQCILAQLGSGALVDESHAFRNGNQNMTTTFHRGFTDPSAAIQEQMKNKMIKYEYSLQLNRT